VKYATDGEVEGAILKWRGKVVAAAGQLGIQPKNLRKRLKALGIDLAAVRAGRYAKGATPQTPSAPDDPRGPRGPMRPSVSPSGPRNIGSRKSEQSRDGLSKSVAAPPTFHAVAQASATADVESEDLPLAKGKRAPARIYPEHQDEVADLRRQLSALYGRDLDDTALANLFFVDTWGAWAEDQLARAKAATKSGRAAAAKPRASKGGQE
jgi:hypothetical protein